MAPANDNSPAATEWTFGLGFLAAICCAPVAVIVCLFHLGWMP